MRIRHVSAVAEVNRSEVKRESVDVELPCPQESHEKGEAKDSEMSDWAR